MRTTVILSVLFTTACTTRPVAFEARFSPEAEQLAARRRQLITDELGRSHHADWAGTYYQGDGLGENVTLLIAPESGYVFEWNGCVGLYDRNYGEVDIVDGHIRLDMAFDTSSEDGQGLSSEFVPVRWGDRRYLVPADELAGFCSDAIQGVEPRADMHGRYLLRVGDERKSAPGWPEVGAADLDRLLPRPVHARVVSVGDVHVRPGLSDWFFEDIEVSLDAGSHEGLRSGMQLYVIEPANVSYSVHLTSVRPGRSDGLYTRMTRLPGLPPQPGWCVSTGPYWRDVLMEPAPPAR